MILETLAECEVKTKDDFDLFHCNGLNLRRLLFSAISAENKSIEVWLHEELISFSYLTNNLSIAS